MATDVSYQFLPWVRSGLAATLTDRDTLDEETPGRARLGVRVNVARRAGTPLPVDQQLVVLGPGDVIGLDPRQVIRTDPRPGATDVEPNFLVQAELDRPDLPWLFTPAAATTTEQLRPWLVLVVVAVGPGVSRQQPGGGPLPVLDLRVEADPGRQLPDLAESWAWAHGQAVLLPGEQVGQVLTAVPQRNAARLLCPRRLDPTTRYLACIVPAFEAGRRAGLGLPPEPADEAALRPAWTPASTSVTLPIYYAWEFTTGVGGDFESLARALRPRPLPEGVGLQPVYFGAAGEPLPARPADAEGGVVELPGALVPPGSSIPAWPAATRQQVQTGLRELLDAPARRVGAPGDEPDDQPAVTPPVYGQWPAAQPTVPRPADEPAWLRGLNLDPRNRAVAGLGALIVAGEQEQLIDQAWSQVGQVEQANRELRWAQLAREVRASVLRRHVQPLPPGDVLALTAAVHGRLPVRSTTVAVAVAASRLPDAVVSGTFRRAVGPRSPLVRRMQLAGEHPPRRLIDGLDTGELRMGGPGEAPDGLFGFARAAPARADVPDDVLARLTTARNAARTKPARPLIAARLRQVLTPVLAERINGALGLSASAGVVVAERFLVAAQTTARRAAALADVPADPVPAPLGVGSIVGELLTRLDPRVTVPARLRDRVRAPDTVRPRPGRDPLEQILAAPVFSQPVWELVRAYAPHLLLPGLDRVPQDTATLAETNPVFAEAALVGLNHEVARELLWREYPTDQRGSCFRKFWAPAGDDDIPAIHTWLADDLGEHTSSAAAARLVLLLRGRLLFRYPSTVVYAAPDRSGRPDISDDTVLLPTFRGRLDPDVAFCGFALSRDDAVGTPGWWFVLEEQPTEPRFGLDVAERFGAAAGPVNEWNDLSWGHLAADAEELAELTHLRADLQPPSPPAGPRWGGTAGAMAAILAQQPVRVALRAADLLAGLPGDDQ